MEPTTEDLWIRHTRAAARWGVEATLRHLLAMYHPLLVEPEHRAAVAGLLDTNILDRPNNQRDRDLWRMPVEPTHQGQTVAKLADLLRNLVRFRIAAESLNHSSPDTCTGAWELYEEATSAALDYLAWSMRIRP